MTTFTSPSGTRSITIEDACFMDCTHTVYRNYFILQKQVGYIYLDSGRICRMKERIILEWNKDETQIEWQVNNSRGTLMLE